MSDLFYFFIRKANKLLFGVAVCLPFFLYGDHDDSDPSTWLLMEVGYESDVHHRGIKKSDSALQMSFNVQRDDWFTGAWFSQPFDRSDLNEVNIYGAYSHSLTEEYSVEFLATYYSYPESRSSLGQTENSFEVGPSFRWEAGYIEHQLHAYYDFNYESLTVEYAGLYMHIVRPDKHMIEFGLNLGQACGADFLPNNLGGRVSDSYTYIEVGVLSHYRFSDRILLTAGLNWMGVSNLGFAQPIENSIPRNAVWFSVGVTFDLE